MWSYALNTPIKKGAWTPPKQEEIPVEPHSSQKTQHNYLTWLIGKPANHGIFPVEAKSGRFSKEK